MMNGIFFLTHMWGADANTRTDNILCDTTKMCCQSHNDRPDIPQRLACTARCAGFYTKDGS